MPDEQVVRSMLQRVARRLWVWCALRRLLRATAVVSVAVVLLLASGAGLGTGARGATILGIAAAGLAIAMIPGLRRVTAAQAARTLDATFGLGERFTTAVECLGQAGGMPRLVVQDAARWSYRLDVRRIPRAPVGRDGWMAGCGVLAASLVWLGLSGPGGLRPAPDGPPDAAALQPVRAAETRQAGVAAPLPAEARSQVRAGLRQALGLDSEEPTARASQGARAMPAPDRQWSGAADPRTAGPAAGTSGGRAASSERGELPRHAGGARPGPASGAPSARESQEASGAAPDETTAPPGSHPSTRVSGRDGHQRLAAGPETGAPTTHPGMSSRSAITRASGSSGALRVDAVFTRTTVPPALRLYILRYFDELGLPANGEDPS